SSRAASAAGFGVYGPRPAESRDRQEDAGARGRGFLRHAAADRGLGCVCGAGQFQRRVAVLVRTALLVHRGARPVLGHTAAMAASSVPKPCPSKWAAAAVTGDPLVAGSPLARPSVAALGCLATVRDKSGRLRRKLVSDSSIVQHEIDVVYRAARGAAWVL